MSTGCDRRSFSWIFCHATSGQVTRNRNDGPTLPSQFGLLTCGKQWSIGPALCCSGYWGGRSRWTTAPCGPSERRTSPSGQDTAGRRQAPEQWSPADLQGHNKQSFVVVFFKKWYIVKPRSCALLSKKCIYSGCSYTSFSSKDWLVRLSEWLITIQTIWNGFFKIRIQQSKGSSVACCYLLTDVSRRCMCACVQRYCTE